MDRQLYLMQEVQVNKSGKIEKNLSFRNQIFSMLTDFTLISLIHNN